MVLAAVRASPGKADGDRESPARSALASVRFRRLAPGMSTALAVRLAFWLWFIAAIFAGQRLALQHLPPPATPAILLGLTALLLIGYFRLAPLRAWVDSLDLRALVLLHVIRFVGVYFLLLYRRGELPYGFAVPGGIGDIAVATFALVLVFAPLAEPQRLRATSIWNVAGLVDILLVVATAIRLTLAGPSQMQALSRLPLSLLPTFLVPLIIATHIVIFARLARARSAA